MHDYKIIRVLRQKATSTDSSMADKFRHILKLSIVFFFVLAIFFFMMIFLLGIAKNNKLRNSVNNNVPI